MSSQQESTLQSVNTYNSYDEFNVVEEKDNSTCIKYSSDEVSNENKEEDTKNHQDNGKDEEDEEEEKDEDEDEEEINLNSFTFTENSDLYTICVDSVPICYVKDEESARKRMWDLARIQTFDNQCSGWRTNLVEVRQNELHILGSYKFFVVSYDQVLKSISYNRVLECVDTK